MLISISRSSDFQWTRRFSPVSKDFVKVLTLTGFGSVSSSARPQRRLCGHQPVWRAFNPSIGIQDNSLKAWPGICDSFAASDGLFVMQVGREHQFERMARTIGHPEWLKDERFQTREGWRDHVEDTIRPAIEAWAANRTKLEAASALATDGIVAGPCFGADDLLGDPHVRSHNMVLTIDRPDGGESLHVAGNPIKLSKSREEPAERWPSAESRFPRHGKALYFPHDGRWPFAH